MAHDGFLGAFQELQVPSHALLGAGGWEHDAPTSSLLGPHEAVLMEQLVGSRLGVPSSRYASSCYRTPLGSPSNPVAAPVNAARLSCFTDELSRVASSQSLLAEQTPPSPRGGVALHASDGSTSEDGPSRKRKAAPAGGKSKANKEAAITASAKTLETERRAKRSKLAADVGEDTKHGNSKGKEIVAEPPRDYIHVRARRGQATDSHSLAERVRREKIGERMKLLQDIVPGCSKVTGKAVMLDEIINYVQSLQRQVEFLSMKLSTVNPRLEVDVDSFVQEDVNQSRCVPASPTSLSQQPPPVYSNTAFCYASPPAPPVQSPATTNAKGSEPPASSFGSHGIQDHSLDGFQNSNAQIGNPWEDDLQSLVQMGFRGNT